MTQQTYDRYPVVKFFANGAFSVATVGHSLCSSAESLGPGPGSSIEAKSGSQMLPGSYPVRCYSLCLLDQSVVSAALTVAVILGLPVSV